MSKECRDIEQLHPKLQELVRAFLKECLRQGLNISLGETYRTVERQDYLYAQGRTRPGNVVTNAKGSSKSSYHQWRLAFDIFNNVPGDLYNEKVITQAGKIGQALGLEWGGSWTGFVDRPHFQYTFGLSIKQLNAGTKIPVYVPKDTDLCKAVEALVLKGVIGSPAAWNSIDKINLKNVPALLNKMGGVDRLIKDKIISNGLLWTSKSYTVDHVRSLIIKYSILG